MTRSIQHRNWAALGANLGSALLVTLLLLSPFLWGAPLWHWLLAVAIAVVLGLYFYVRRAHYEEPGRTPTKPDSPVKLCPPRARSTGP
jgi:cell division protein FtsW (lipid II flippase)